MQLFVSQRSKVDLCLPLLFIIILFAREKNCFFSIQPKKNTQEIALFMIGGCFQNFGNAFCSNTNEISRKSVTKFSNAVPFSKTGGINSVFAALKDNHNGLKKIKEQKIT